MFEDCEFEKISVRAEIFRTSQDIDRQLNYKNTGATNDQIFPNTLEVP